MRQAKKVALMAGPVIVVVVRVKAVQMLKNIKIHAVVSTLDVVIKVLHKRAWDPRRGRKESP